MLKISELSEVFEFLDSEFPWVFNVGIQREARRARLMLAVARHSHKVLQRRDRWFFRIISSRFLYFLLDIDRRRIGGHLEARRSGRLHKSLFELDD